MCGIYFRWSDILDNVTNDETSLDLRGPDNKQVIKFHNYTMSFHRLAINGLTNGMQPFYNEEKTIYLMCNGEIYNHEDIRSEYKLPARENPSDCHIILDLYLAGISVQEITQILDGEFAFVLIDDVEKLVFFARDLFGVKPLYMSSVDDAGDTTVIELSSTIDAMTSDNITHVEPRYLYCLDIAKQDLSKIRYGRLMSNELHSELRVIYHALEHAVIKRVTHSERPVGFFLSGGLDSSAILSLALKANVFKEPPKVFTFGFDENAPDVLSAKIVVEFLRAKYGKDCIDWHLVIQDTSAGLKALPDVIKHLGTCDTTTVRASTPMYLLSKYISENTDVKVLLTGEGADELFGGYLYFKFARNKWTYRAEILKLLNELHYYDVLRCDRMTACHGLEVRPPFLDKELVYHVLMCKELKPAEPNTKFLLRMVLNRNNLLPDVIINGKKEAFSDAVSLSWQDQVEIHAKEFVKSHPLTECSNVKDMFPVGATEIYFQHLFSKHVAHKPWNLCEKLWLPNQSWVKTGREPSARVLDNY